ncbi:acyltransferase family protein [Microbacterium horticulturae]|uniref:Acyltransferase family protein n=1 Tax=Microbacterium horticulturae TaxID=3028316 RepID=A0ABY8BZY8_9MICO|nr:acyltransferase family protein [Microbacterium sp. KACC 23027]WEG08173.1 acyltransferase family protein [Microbacterium sp. KACC 23027]
MTQPSSARRYAGLDGLRAIAVALVVIYHLFPGWMLHSGFIGVDMFFVISGFLITSLLLRDRTDLVDFWRRRARRLLPALVVLVTVAATWAWAIGGDVLVRLGPQVLGAATFSYNWVSIAGGADYFSADTPELFRNLWSLAVEEQFYWVWPLLLPLLLLVRRRWLRACIALTAAVASALWMAHVVGAGTTRAYFGTDTHAFGLLLGVALAVGLERAAPPRWLSGRAGRALGATLGALALAGIVVVATLPETQDAASFPGTLAAASLLTAVVLVAATAPGSRLGPVLDIAPLRWIGDRSYGIYLWHWPLLVLLTAMFGTPAWLGAAVLVLTIGCAAVSHRWVEGPVRRHGFRGVFGMLRARLRGAPAPRFRALVAMVLAVVVIGGTTAAIATAPGETSGRAAVEAGQRALAHRTPGLRPPLVRDGRAARSTAPAPVDGAQIDAIGDSVMLAAAPALLERYPGIRIDAEVSRSMWTAPGIIGRLGDGLRDYVVLGLGTNGAVEGSVLDRVRNELGPDRHLVLVTASAPRAWIPGVNKELRAYAGAHPDVLVADWAGAIAPHEDLLAGDHIHPGEAGGRYYADAVADAISADQRARTRSHDRLVLRVGEFATVDATD